METAQQSKWKFGQQPTGHNDVFWCHASNSPAVFLNSGNVCSLCGQRMVDDPNVHSFVVHIEKES